MLKLLYQGKHLGRFSIGNESGSSEVISFNTINDLDAFFIIYESTDFNIYQFSAIYQTSHIVEVTHNQLDVNFESKTLNLELAKFNSDRRSVSLYIQFDRKNIEKIIILISPVLQLPNENLLFANGVSTLTEIALKDSRSIDKLFLSPTDREWFVFSQSQLALGVTPDYDRNFSPVNLVIYQNQLPSNLQEINQNLNIIYKGEDYFNLDTHYLMITNDVKVVGYLQLKPDSYKVKMYTNQEQYNRSLIYFLVLI